MSKTAIVVLVLILVIGGAILLFKHQPPISENRVLAGRIVLTGHRNDGSPAWSIEAQSGSLDGDVGTLEVVELTLFTDLDTPIAVSGDRLTRDPGGSTLSGSVRVEQADTLSLVTETVFWDERNDILESGPVTVEMAAAMIEAGAFHHDLDAGVTALTHGITTRLTQDGEEYTVRSEMAEATSDQLALIGGVSIQTEEGDDYRCHRLESDVSGTLIHLLGDVSGRWQGSAFSADTVQLDDTGIRLQGNVTMDLELLMMSGRHDT